MWAALGEPLTAPDGVAGFRTPSGDRYLATRPLDGPALAEIVDRPVPVGRTVLEDLFGPAPDGPVGVATVLRMPLMERPPAPVAAVRGPGLSVAPVDDADALAEAERVIVDGFPQPYLRPWVRGRSLPPRVLAVPGWRVWLARRDGLAAAAGYSFDDGAALGVYWLATLPAHRGAGLGRAVMAAMLAAYPDRTATLVATDAGVPLYTGLGFAPVAPATWYVRTG